MNNGPREFSQQIVQHIMSARMFMPPTIATPLCAAKPSLVLSLNISYGPGAAHLSTSAALRDAD